MLRLLSGVVMATLLALALTSAPSEAGEPAPEGGRLAVTATPTPTRTPGLPKGFSVSGNDWRPVYIEGATGSGTQQVACVNERSCWVNFSTGDHPYQLRMYRTTDGGTNWDQLWDAVRFGLGYRAVPTPAVAATPMAPSSTLFPPATHLRPAPFFFVDAKNGFSEHGFTNDGGSTWTPIKFQDSRLADLRFASADTAYACALDLGKLYRTRDAGRTFEHWAEGCAPEHAAYLSGDVAWGLIDYFSNALWYTRDGWRTRSDVVVGQADDAVGSPTFVGFEFGWAGATNYRRYGSQNQYREELGAAIYRTSDGGVTWRRIPLHERYLAVHQVAFVDQLDGWAVVRATSGMELLRSQDGGETWVAEIVGTDPVAGFIHMNHLQFHDRTLGWLNLGRWDSIICCPAHLFKHYPGLALTPTATPTATPTSLPTTPTPTRTPFDPFLPTATATSSNPKLTPTPSHTPGPGTPTATPTPPAITCEWSGQWAANASGEAFTMTLTRQGNLIDGVYHGDRRLSGFAEGNRLNGRWAGPPSFSEPLNAGRFAFTVAADCQSFTGTWGFGSSAIGGGGWSGQRVATQDRIEMVRAAYLAVLGREADPTGLNYWAGTTLARFNIEAALTASEEGQRVTAVRALYRELLLRDPLGSDNAGLRSWVDSPLSLDEIRRAWSAEPEVQRVLAIRALYRGLLGRDDDLPGIRYWASSPLTLEQIRIEFMNSDEYRRRHGG